MPLDKRTVEIPLAVGMATKPNADMQSVDSMRALTDLRFDALGELRKRPTYDDNVSVTDPAEGSYEGGTPSGMFARAGEVCVLTQNYGIASVSDDCGITYAYRDVAASSSRDEDGLKYAPVGATVSRKFLHGAQLGSISAGVVAATSAIYSGVLAVGWYETGSTPMMCFRAYDLESGKVIAATEYATTIGYSLAAIEYTESGKEGVLFAYTTGIVAPMTVATIRYNHATRTFVTDSNLSTNLGVSGFSLAKSGTSFYFAFRDNTTGFLKAQLRTVSTVASTHDGTTASVRFSIVVGEDYTAIFHGTTSTVYVEYFGTPASIDTIFTASSEVFYALKAELDLSSASATVCVNAQQSTTPPADEHFNVRWAAVGFVGGVSFLNVANGRIPHAFHTGSSFRHGGRSYHVFALAQDLADEAPTTTGIVARVQISDSLSRWHPVARVCHDRMCVYDQYSLVQGGNSAAVVDDTAYFVALADRSEVEPTGLTSEAPQTIFLSTVKLGTMPNVIDVGEGVAMGATGLCWEYDGLTPAESQPLNIPRIDSTSNTGTGTTLTSGISIKAIYRWVDGAGRLHRSAPSNTEVIGAIANKSIVVYVSKPPFVAYDGITQLEYMEPELYATADGGSTYYMCLKSGAKHTYDASSNSWWRFDSVQAGSSSSPQLYSDGTGTQELTSEPPPAFCSAARIGDRVWGIDAEDRTRVWFSKTLVAGFGVEWNTANTLIIGDEGVVVVDSGGVPTILGKNGIWQVYGEGPNNTGVGSFAPARRMPTDVACTSATGVCRTPMGVVFRGRRGVYLLGGGGDVQPLGLPIDPELRTPVDANAGDCRILYDEFHNEVRVLDSVNGLFVYNLAEQKWSEWTQAAGIQKQLDACIAGGRVWYLHDDGVDGYKLRREMGVDETGHSLSTGTWVIESPRIQMGGVSGAHRLWRAYVTIRLAANPSNLTSITVQVTSRGQFGEQTHTHSWTGAQLAEMGGEDDVVDLPLHISAQRAKSHVFTITETPNTAYSGSVPLALRLEYGVEPSHKTAAPKGGTVAS